MDGLRCVYTVEGLRGADSVLYLRLKGFVIYVNSPAAISAAFPLLIGA